MTGRRMSRVLTTLALAGAIVAGSSAAAQAQGPPAPTGLRVTGTTASTATLAWNASSGAAQYRVLEFEYDSNAGEYREALRATVTATTATVENLMPNRSYLFLVRAVDGSGNASAASETVFAETPLDTQGPTTPGNARVTDVSFTTVKLEWERSTDDHFVVGYFLSVDGSAPTYTTGDLSATVRRLVPGKQHTVEVSARDSFGNFSPPARLTFTTVADNEPPTAPTNLTGNTSHLTWGASQDNSGETNYVLFVDGRQSRAEAGFDTTFLFFDDCNTFFPAAPGTHTATVRARDRAGNLSAPSNAITVVVQ
jgi:chitodextrinase